MPDINSAKCSQLFTQQLMKADTFLFAFYAIHVTCTNGVDLGTQSPLPPLPSNLLLMTSLLYAHSWPPIEFVLVAEKMYFWSFFLWNCWLFMLLNCKAKAQDILPVKRLTSPVRKNCTKSLVDFAEAVSNYTYCAIQSSRPFRFCGNCKSYYTSALDEHGAIENRCGNELSVGEKYQIVESSNSFVVKLWERSNCPRKYQLNEGFAVSVPSPYIPYLSRHHACHPSVYLRLFRMRSNILSCCLRDT